MKTVYRQHPFLYGPRNPKLLLLLHRDTGQFFFCGIYWRLTEKWGRVRRGRYAAKGHKTTIASVHLAAWRGIFFSYFVTINIIIKIVINKCYFLGGICCKCAQMVIQIITSVLFFFFFFFYIWCKLSNFAQSFHQHIIQEKHRLKSKTCFCFLFRNCCDPWNQF